MKQIIDFLGREIKPGDNVIYTLAADKCLYTGMVKCIQGDKVLVNKLCYESGKDPYWKAFAKDPYDCVLLTERKSSIW